MFILDSLTMKSITSVATEAFEELIEQPTKQDQTDKTVNHLINKRNQFEKTTFTTKLNIENDAITNNCKQQEQSDVWRQKNKVVEACVMPKEEQHKIVETIKNNHNFNISFNDELPPMTAIENKTPIADNTMPEEQHENNGKDRGNGSGIKWDKVPVKCKCNNKCSGWVCNSNTNHQAITDTLKSDSESAINRLKEIMLTNIQTSGVNHNLFLISSSTAATTSTTTTTAAEDTVITIQNANSNGSVTKNTDDSMSAAIADNKMTFFTSSSFPRQQQNEQCCSENSNGIYDDASGSNDGNNFCHSSNNSSGNNNNNIILNTNNFVTVQCALSTCENEREQDKRKQKENGYKNSWNSVATTVTTSTTTTTTTTPSDINGISTVTLPYAELSSDTGRENECYALCYDTELSDNNPIGNVVTNTNDNFGSPLDSVLENFEKFLNNVKLENQNLQSNIPECNDLIDLSDDIIEGK